MDQKTQSNPLSGETGRTFQIDRLYPQGDPRRNEIERTLNSDIPYQNLRDAIIYCLTKNPSRYSEEKDETWDPPTQWLREVHYEIAQNLNLQDWSNLRVFSALGTAADRYHGIDWFIVYTDPVTEQDILVTVDFSLRKGKETGYKADVIVSDTGAFPNQEYYPHLVGYDIPSIKGESREEETEKETERRKLVADVITDVIAEKLVGYEDPHYGSLITRIKMKRLLGRGGVPQNT